MSKRARESAIERTASEAATFDAQYTPALIEDATRVFRDYRFKRYGALLIAACVVNALAFGFVAWQRAASGLTLFWLVFIVAAGPTWLLYEYFLAPSRFAARLKRALPSSTRVSFGRQSVSFLFGAQAVSVPWSDIKAVVETGTLFLLVVSPFTFVLLPRAGIPPAGYRALHARSQPTAA